MYYLSLSENAITVKKILKGTPRQVLKSCGVPWRIFTVKFSQMVIYFCSAWIREHVVCLPECVWRGQARCPCS